LGDLLAEIDATLHDFHQSAQRHELWTQLVASAPKANALMAPRGKKGSPSASSSRNAALAVPVKVESSMPPSPTCKPPKAGVATHGGGGAMHQSSPQRLTMVFNRMGKVAREPRAAGGQSKDAYASLSPAQLGQIRLWLRERNQLARSRIDQWRRERPDSAQLVATGFIEGDVPGSFLASAYELKVRLSHTLERGRLLLEVGSQKSRADGSMDGGLGRAVSG
jgi:hypothetical protein